ncbi:hypothetical protein SLE2022_023200 [Rubroshorea leprosula]
MLFREIQRLTHFSLYLQSEDGEEESEGPDSESDEVLDLYKITKTRLIPSDAGQCVCISELVCLDSFCTGILAV